jgi:carbon-monoxide dehydrogenase medium subunit
MFGFSLSEPRSLEEAFGLLESGDPSVRPMGGGTALMLMMKAQIFRPTRLVSLRHVGGSFNGIALNSEQDSMRVGALSTFSDLEHSPLVKQHFPAIVETMKTLANVRVRHVASVGGNLAHADPHLDLPPVWMALDASAEIVNKSGKRVAQVADIFAGYYETTLESGELISEVRVPLRPTWRSTYVKVTTRALHDWPALGLAISADLDGCCVKDLRIVLSAALDKPTRLFAAEDVLRGAEITDSSLRGVGEAAEAEVEIHSDGRGSAAYKKHLLRVHLARAFESLTGA